MIHVAHLTYRNLEIPELVIPPGTSALIGPNGSGKTTLLKIIAGLLEPGAATVSSEGRSPRDCRIGYVNEYPDRNILFSRVSDEVAGPLRFGGVPCGEIPGRVHEAAERAGLLHLVPRSMHTLSGGEKALVALLAATIHKPEMLILDEFDSHLDDQAFETAEGMIAASGAATVVQCTQNMETASRAGTIIALFGGRVRSHGTPGQVFSSLSGTCYVPLGWRPRP